MTGHVIFPNTQMKFFRSSFIHLKVHLLDYGLHHYFENSTRQKESYHSQEYFINIMKFGLGIEGNILS